MAHSFISGMRVLAKKPCKDKSKILVKVRLPKPIKAKGELKATEWRQMDLEEYLRKRYFGKAPVATRK